MDLNTILNLLTIVGFYKKQIVYEIKYYRLRDRVDLFINIKFKNEISELHCFGAVKMQKNLFVESQSWARNGSGAETIKKSGKFNPNC